jgi:predicted lactoylglutathione lyase
MLETAALITIGIDITAEQQADKTLITRAAASFFSDLGFKTNEQGTDNYTLRANVRFQTITQSVISCRCYLDTALVNRNGTAAFAFTTDDRKAHPDTASEARRLAVRAVETSFKEGQFANEFNSWLMQMSNEQ